MTELQRLLQSVMDAAGSTAMICRAFPRLLRPLVLALLVAVASSALAQSRPDTVWKVALPAQPCAYAVSPDGTLLASGYENSLVTVHRTEDGAMVHTLTAPSAVKEVLALAFAGGGQYLMVSRRMNTASNRFVGYYRMSDGQVEETFHTQIPAGEAWSLATSPDGRYIAWGGQHQLR